MKWTGHVTRMGEMRNTRKILVDKPEEMNRLGGLATQPLIHWVPGASTPGVKQPGREADHSPPSSAEVKNAWSYTSTPPIRLGGVALN
jgi:hypothetical protein